MPGQGMSVAPFPLFMRKGTTAEEFAKASRKSERNPSRAPSRPLANGGSRKWPGVPLLTATKSSPFFVETYKAHRVSPVASTGIATFLAQLASVRHARAGALRRCPGLMIHGRGTTWCSSPAMADGMERFVPDLEKSPDPPNAATGPSRSIPTRVNKIMIDWLKEKVRVEPHANQICPSPAERQPRGRGNPSARERPRAQTRHLRVITTNVIERADARWLGPLPSARESAPSPGMTIMASAAGAYRPETGPVSRPRGGYLSTHGRFRRSPLRTFSYASPDDPAAEEVQSFRLVERLTGTALPEMAL